jgi:hypothetical protein
MPARKPFCETSKIPAAPGNPRFGALGNPGGLNFSWAVARTSRIRTPESKLAPPKKRFYQTKPNLGKLGSLGGIELTSPAAREFGNCSDLAAWNGMLSPPHGAQTQYYQTKPFSVGASNPPTDHSAVSAFSLVIPYSGITAMKTPRLPCQSGSGSKLSHIKTNEKRPKSLSNKGLQLDRVWHRPCIQSEGRLPPWSVR